VFWVENGNMKDSESNGRKQPPNLSFPTFFANVTLVCYPRTSSPVCPSLYHDSATHSGD